MRDLIKVSLLIRKKIEERKSPAPCGISTHDLSVTRCVLYRCAPTAARNTDGASFFFLSFCRMRRTKRLWTDLCPFSLQWNLSMLSENGWYRRNIQVSAILFPRPIRFRCICHPWVQLFDWAPIKRAIINDMIGMKVCQKERERVRKKMYDVPVLVFGANDTSQAFTIGNKSICRANALPYLCLQTSIHTCS